MPADWHDWCESSDGQGWYHYNAPLTFTTGVRPVVGGGGTGIYGWLTTNTSTSAPAWINWSTATVTSATSYTLDGWQALTWRGRQLVVGDEEAPVLGVDVRREAQRADAAAAVRRRAEARVVADARAVDLLVSLLPPEQVDVYRQHGHFEIVGSHGTLYRINTGVSGNVEWITPDGEVGGQLCAHPTMAESWLPTPDVMLSQMLALLTDEPEFVRLANVHAGRRPQLAAA
jgi:hypothetical protein